ncbi:unnamed protein product [Calypogeia fissa]
METSFSQQALQSGAVDDNPKVKEALQCCASPKELIDMHILDEISNAKDAQPEIDLPDAIERYVRFVGGMIGRKQSKIMPKIEVTQKACFFVVYQTQRLGPQNGFRLCLVEKGARPAIASSQLGGDVAQDSCEVVVVGP